MCKKSEQEENIQLPKPTLALSFKTITIKECPIYVY